MTRNAEDDHFSGNGAAVAMQMTKIIHSCNFEFREADPGTSSLLGSILDLIGSAQSGVHC